MTETEYLLASVNNAAKLRGSTEQFKQGGLKSYELDEGALTMDQIRAIRQANPATNTPEDSFTERLF